MRITAAQRTENENRIRAAMDRLLRGEIPPGGNCDIKTLAREAHVDRTAFYGHRPYAHLRAEFEHRLQHLQQAGQTPSPRTAQIDRMKTDIGKLKDRLSQADQRIGELTDFRRRSEPSDPSPDAANHGDQDPQLRQHLCDLHHKRQRRMQHNRPAAPRKPARQSTSSIATRSHPHTASAETRHTFVTTMLDAGVDLRDVQIAARHADPRTTMRYDRARKNLDRHPNYILAAYMASGT